ncbi:hypothetical protein H0R92_09335 [Treponema sp. OMZ 840]|uniref:hypothetical protein n=1 Tax=Treponema sp. OMZ 840 TaxID=244313 RepID=UPI003D8BF7FF
MQYDVPLWYKTEFVKRYGAVSRARGCYLYTQKGVRITDMYRDSGRAVLGWGCSGSKAFKIFKNTLERGQTGSFPCEYERRFEKAVLALLGSYDHARWFLSAESLLTSVYQSAWGEEYAEKKSMYGIKLWRPWFPEHAEIPSDGLFVQPDTKTCNFIPGVCALYPPFALSTSGYIAVFEKKEGAEPPRSDTCSPALLNALARAVYDLSAEIPRRSEKDFSAFDFVLGQYFIRSGAYFMPKIKSEQYKDFVLHCLDCALLLAPVCTVPSVVPFGASQGDFSQLKRKPF